MKNAMFFDYLRVYVKYKALSPIQFIYVSS